VCASHPRAAGHEAQHEAESALGRRGHGGEMPVQPLPPHAEPSLEVDQKVELREEHAHGLVDVIELCVFFRDCCFLCACLHYPTLIPLRRKSKKKNIFRACSTFLADPVSRSSPVGHCALARISQGHQWGKKEPAPGPGYAYLHGKIGFPASALSRRCFTP